MRYIILLLLLASCAQPGPLQEAADINSEPKYHPEPTETSCEDRAASLIPERLSFSKENQLGTGWGLLSEMQRWKDGTWITFDEGFTTLRRGQRAGENLNFYYPVDDLLYSSWEVKDDGSIVGKKFFRAELELRAVPGTERKAERDGLSVNTKDFEVMSYSIEDCEWS